MAKEEKKYEYNIGTYEIVYRKFILSLLNEYDIDYQEELVSKYYDLCKNTL